MHEGMRLVLIGSAADNDAVLAAKAAANLGSLGVWLGGTSSWYANWADGQPDHAPGNNCLSMLADGTWHEHECHLSSAYVCESPAFEEMPLLRHVGGLVLQTSAATWDAARSDCMRTGGRLPVIGSAADNDAVIAARSAAGMADHGLWLASATAWYTNWADGQPDLTDDYSYDKPNNCKVLLGDGKWADVNCGQSYSYACEYAMSPPPYPPGMNPRPPLPSPPPLPMSPPTPLPPPIGWDLDVWVGVGFACAMVGIACCCCIMCGLQASCRSQRAKVSTTGDGNDA